MGDISRVVDEWTRDGYSTMRLLSDAEVARATEAVDAVVPTLEAFESQPEQFQRNGQIVSSEFPFNSDLLRSLTLHPTLLEIARAILGTDDLRLTQSMIWSKYAGPDSMDYDQEMHTDFSNNSLVVPPDDGRPDQVPFILYLSDAPADLGPTCLVPLTHTEGIPLSPRFKSREDHPELYAAERAMAVPAGTLLINGMRTFHRGTRMTATSGRRVTMHIVYRRADAEWASWTAWAPVVGHWQTGDEMARFLTSATPEIRSLFGFPAPGHPYWTRSMVTEVGLRYPGMDMTPYLALATA